MLNVPSSVVIITSIASLLGFAINVLVMSVILMREEESIIFFLRRHIGYILASFVIFGIATVKVLPTYDVDAPFLLPIGILVDSFGVVIGLAIVKDRLFDVTLYVKKGLSNSLLTAIIIFIFEFSQHLTATFLEGIMGEYSSYARTSQ